MGRRKQRGFSLIELLIVVGIILIIAAIAIPNLMRSRIAADESAAVGSLRVINVAAVTYAVVYPQSGYPSNLTVMGYPGGSSPVSSSQAGLLDSLLAQDPAVKRGYTIIFAGDGKTPSASYCVNANPFSSFDGTRYFYTDQSGIIRGNFDSTATSASSAISQ